MDWPTFGFTDSLSHSFGPAPHDVLSEEALMTGMKTAINMMVDGELTPQACGHIVGVLLSARIASRVEKQLTGLRIPVDVVLVRAVKGAEKVVERAGEAATNEPSRKR